jgi:hypothetical protein
MFKLKPLTTGKILSQNQHNTMPESTHKHLQIIQESLNNLELLAGCQMSAITIALSHNYTDA